MRASLAILLMAGLACAAPDAAAVQIGQQKHQKKIVATAKPKEIAIERAGLLILIRGPLTALDQANKTGNYTVLRDLGGPTFQANSAAQLGDFYAPLRQQQVDLAPALALEPIITTGPQIEINGLMRVAGYFPTNPRQINFEIAYQAVGPAWRIFGIAITTSEPKPTPTTPQP